LKTTNQIQTPPIAYCIGKKLQGRNTMPRLEGRKEGRIHPPSIKLKHPCQEEEEEEEEEAEEIIIIIMTMKSETQKKTFPKLSFWAISSTVKQFLFFGQFL
jgi:hypothetical protein